MVFAVSRRQIPFQNLDGLGDVVYGAAKATGVNAVMRVVEKVTGKDCGCAKRRKRLNKAVPFKKGKQ